MFTIICLIVTLTVPPMKFSISAVARVSARIKRKMINVRVYAKP